MQAKLTIGQLAHHAGVGVETVRFYERQQLLEQPKRPTGGFRHYPVTYIERINFIQRAQSAGFSLREIQELLSLKSNKGARCGEVREHAQHKLEVTEQKLKELKEIRRSLKCLLEACSGAEGIADCTILNVLSGRSPWCINKSHHHLSVKSKAALKRKRVEAVKKTT